MWFCLNNRHRHITSSRKSIGIFSKKNSLLFPLYTNENKSYNRGCKTFFRKTLYFVNHTDKHPHTNYITFHIIKANSEGPVSHHPSLSLTSWLLSRIILINVIVVPVTMAMVPIPHHHWRNFHHHQSLLDIQRDTSSLSRLHVLLLFIRLVKGALPLPSRLLLLVVPALLLLISTRNYAIQIPILISGIPLHS